MKPIDKNQQRILYYLRDNGSATRDELLPLIEWDEDRNRAYNAVIAKLTMTGTISSTPKIDGGRELFEYRLTEYGKMNMG